MPQNLQCSSAVPRYVSGLSIWLTTAGLNPLDICNKSMLTTEVCDPIELTSLDLAFLHALESWLCQTVYPSGRVTGLRHMQCYVSKRSQFQSGRHPS